MKNNFRNSIYGTLGFICPLAITLITTPYIVHKLTPEIYGVYLLSISLTGLMSFMDLGFGQGIIKFVSEYEAKKDYEGIRDIIGVSSYIYLGMGIIGAIIIFAFANNLVVLFKVNEEYKDLARYVFHITAIGFLISFLTNLFCQIPMALQRYDIATKVQTAIWLLLNLSIVGLLYLGYGLKEVIIASLGFGMVRLVGYFLIFKRMLPGMPLKPAFKPEVFKKIFSFSIFTAINGITGTIVFRVDKMIISSFLGTNAVTYYTIPFMMIQMGFGLVGSATKFIFPVTSNVSSLGLKEELKGIYKKATKYTAVMSSVFTAGFIILGGTFLTLWMGVDFARNAEQLIPIIAIVFFFQSVGVPGFHIYNGLGFPRINMISSMIGSAAYLLAALILIPAFKLTGAALSFAFTLLPFPLYFYYLHRVIETKNMDFFTLLIKTLSIIGITYTLFFVLGNIVNIQPSIVSLIAIGISLIILSLGIAFLFGVVKKEELIVLLNRLRRETV
ncbi:MAG: oligosaccharide flippase family protein [bacterium]|nr:oligosaccharide flippase family protein [bacterium]